jgi:transcriptional regulator with GAF, ATPase, and Fis domain
VFTVLERTAPSNATILVVGETGTGKEVVAQAVHRASPRKDGPLVVVDCGAIPHNLIESELFGHKKGAFTDANTDRSGAFEAANGGTLFLDEIGELPLELQPKLLRAVESRSIQRLGENERRAFDVRLIAATHRDLHAMVSAGTFRQDLFFRLAVVTLQIPPLRERGDDVIFLAKHILAELGHADAIEIDGEIAEAMLAYSWPGNVRELRNAIERAVHLGAAHAIPMVSGDQPVPKSGEQRPLSEEAPDLPFKQAKEQIVVAFEHAYVRRVMDRHEGNISAAGATPASIATISTAC